MVKVRIWFKDINVFVEYTFSDYDMAMQCITTLKDHQTAATLPIQYLIQEELLYYFKFH